jgi:hypothetical protein
MRHHLQRYRMHYIENGYSQVQGGFLIEAAFVF